MTFFTTISSYITTEYGLLIGSALIVIALLLWNIRLEWKIRRLLSGKDARSLEDTIVHLRAGHDDLSAFRTDVEEYLKQVETRLRKSVQGVHTIRFNPFHGIGAGGNQSFSTAFLNEHGDGVVISSLYARDRMSFYAKTVEHFTSPHELTDEEKEAITKARESLTHRTK